MWPIMCDINPADLTGINNENSECYDIARLVADMITQTSDFVDVYIEIPFLAYDSPRPSRSFFLDKMEEIGYLYKLAATFWPCLDKSSGPCPYNNVRFHYVDTRLEFSRRDTDKWITEFISLETYLLKVRLENCVEILVDMMDNPNPTTISMILKESLTIYTLVNP